MPITRQLTQQELEEIASYGEDPALYAGKEVEVLTPDEMAQQNARAIVGDGGKLSAIGAALKARAGGLIGSAGGATAASWLLGPEVGLPVTVLALGLGAMAGGAGGEKLQRTIVPESIQKPIDTQAEAYRTIYPKITTATELVAGALAGGGKPNLSAIPKALGGASELATTGVIRNAVSRQAFENIVKANALNAGVQTGIEGGRQLLTTGEIDPSELAKSAGLGLAAGTVFSDPSRLGRKLFPHWKPLEESKPIETQDRASNVTQSDNHNPDNVEELVARKAKEKQLSEEALQQHDEYRQQREAQATKEIQLAAAEEKRKAEGLALFQRADWRKPEDYSDATVNRIYRRDIIKKPTKDMSREKADLVVELNSKLAKLPVSVKREQLWKMAFANADPDGYALHQQAEAAKAAEFQQALEAQRAKSQAIRQSVEEAQVRKAEDAAIEAEQQARMEQWLQRQAQEQQQAQEAHAAEIDQRIATAKAQEEAARAAAKAEKERQLRDTVNTKAITARMTSGVARPEQLPRSDALSRIPRGNRGTVRGEGDAADLAQAEYDKSQGDKYHAATLKDYVEPKVETPATDETLLKQAGRQSMEIGQLPQDEPLVNPATGREARGVSLDPQEIAGRRIALLSRMATSDTGYHELLHASLRDMDNSGIPHLRRLAKRIRSASGGEEGQVEAGGKEFRDALKSAETATVGDKVSKWAGDVVNNLKVRFGKASEADVRRHLLNITKNAAGENDIVHQNLGVKGTTEKMRPTATASEKFQTASDDDKAEYDRLDAERQAMMKDGTAFDGDNFSPRFTEIWRQIEAVKNRNDGMPPGETSPKRGAGKFQDVVEGGKRYSDLAPEEKQEYSRLHSEAFNARLDHSKGIGEDASSKLIDAELAITNFEKEHGMEDLRSSSDKFQDVKIAEDVNPKSSFFNFLTSRVDKVGSRHKNEAGRIATEQLHKFAGEFDILQGRIGNKLMAASQGYSPESIQKVYQHAHQIDDTGSSSITLSDSEKRLAAKWIELIREPRLMQQKEGPLVKEGKRLRLAGVKPEGYMFNILDPKVAYEWAENPESAQSKVYDKAYTDHQVAHGETPEDAEKMLFEYKGALGSNVAQDVEFGAIRKAEGNGLPWDLVEKNFFSAAGRYAKRAARDLSYFKHLQNNPKVRKALGLSDQYGVLPKPTDEPSISYIGGSDESKQALKSVWGISEKQSPQLMAVSRAVANVVMGPGTAIRNVANIPSFLMNYVQLHQIPKVFEAIRDWNSTTARAFENNATKASYSDFDAAGALSDNPNPVINLMDKFSSNLRKYQGRDFSDKFEGNFYYAVGEKLAADNVLRARAGNKESLRFLRRFGDLVDGGGESLLRRKMTADDQQRLAKRFVDAARGTYSEEGLPSWTLEGPLAPFTALSRFSIEKSNTIYKDVVVPMTQGEYGPLLRYTLASLGVGIGIEELNKLLTNKRGPDPTIAEVEASGKASDKLAKVIGLLQMASFAGFIGDQANNVSKLAQGKTLRYSQPVSSPLYSLTVDTFAGNLGDALEAMQSGEDPIEVAGHLVTDIATQSSQMARYLDANFARPEEAKRRERFRDVKVYRELAEDKTEQEPSKANPYISLQAKEFKRTEDTQRAAALLPSLVRTAFEKAKGNPEVLRAEISKIKHNSYQTMPDLERTPISFRRYLLHLEATQGKQAAVSRMMDYIRQNEVNEVKSSLVPSL